MKSKLYLENKSNRLNKLKSGYDSIYIPLLKEGNIFIDYKKNKIKIEGKINYKYIPPVILYGTGNAITFDKKIKNVLIKNIHFCGEFSNFILNILNHCSPNPMKSFIFSFFQKVKICWNISKKIWKIL